MKVKIEVMLRDAILDPQGNTIKKSLNSLGFKNVKSVRQGKLIEIDLNTSSSNKEKKNIEKIFNEELDALMLLAYIVESLIKKTKRLKLVEVVQLLREITNVEMDLRFEAAAANELYENTKNDVGFKVPKIYWNQTSKKVLCLEKVDGISIREVENLKSLNIDLSKIKTKSIFVWLKNNNIKDSEMLKTFNCGVGFCLITNKRNMGKIKNIFFLVTFFSFIILITYCKSLGKNIYG